MSFEIVFNIMLEDRDDQLTVRYAQVGIIEGGAFTGCIRDYVGGGEYDDFYFLGGEPVEEMFEDGDFDADDCEDALEEARPGLMDAITAFQDGHFEYMSEEPFLVLPRPPLLALFVDAGSNEDAVLSNSEALEPIEVGNTGFH